VVTIGRNGDGMLTINVKLIQTVIAVLLALGGIVFGSIHYVDNRVRELAFSKECGVRIEEQLKSMQHDIKEIKEAVKQ